MNTPSIRLAAALALTALAMGGCAPPEEGEEQTQQPATVADEAAGAVSPDATNACLQIGRTTFDGRYVKGLGSVSCAGNSANLTIRRSRWFGWEDLVTVPINGPGRDVHVTYDCYLTGTHDYVTRIWGNNFRGEYVFKDSNVIHSAFCGN